MKGKYYITATIMLILALVVTLIIAAEPSAYTIEGNKVFINDSTAYISAEPHTLDYNAFNSWKKPQWVNFTVQSKVYTGNVDIVFGFDTETLRPRTIQRYNPVNLSIDRSRICPTEYFNYTIEPNHVWCYENVNETLQLLFEQDFETGNLSSQTIFWTEYRMKYWHDFSNNIDSTYYDYQGMNKWYYAKNLSIVANETYVVRVSMEIQSQDYNKYWFAIKPSGETISESITNNHFYALDPWVNGSGYDMGFSSLTVGLLAAYDFDDASGSNLVDVFGLRNASINGTPNWTTGIINGGLRLDGSTNYINASNNQLIATPQTSYSWWVYPKAGSTLVRSAFIDTDAGATFNFIHYDLGDNIQIYWGDDVYSVTGVEYTDNAWQHYVFTSDSVANVRKFYINGYLNHTDSTAFSDSDSENVYFGIDKSADNRHFGGVMDNMYIWNRSLNASDVLFLYNNGDSVVFDTSPPATPTDVNITYPENETYSSIASLNYTVNYATGSCWYSNSSGVTNSSLNSPGTNWTISALNYSEGSNNYQVWCNSTNSSVVGTDNVTFFIDTINPVINVTTPINSSTVTVGTLDLKYTYTDHNASRCWYSNSSGAWNSTDVAAGTNWSGVIPQIGANSWEVYCNDSTGNIGMNSTNFTLNLIVQNQTFNATQYATGTYNYKANLSYNSALYNLYANITLNNSIYNATVTDVGPDAILSWNQTVPELFAPYNTTFYFTTYLTNKTNVSDIIISNFSVPENISLFNISLFECKDISANTPFAIYDFEDGLTGLPLNASINDMLWVYWLGNSSVNKSLVFTNSTANLNYSFCFSENLTLHNNINFQYLNVPTYPVQIHVSTANLTNVSTNITLILNDVTTGSYSSFNVQDIYGTGLSGVTIAYSKKVAGSYVAQGSVVTDDSGTRSIFVDPTVSYRFEYSLSGYVTKTLDVFPTEPLYTITLERTGSSGGRTPASYFSPVANITWNVTPLNFEPLNPLTTHTFSFEIESSTADLKYYMMNLTNSTGYEIISLNGTVAAGDIIIIAGLNVSNYSKVIGYFWANASNGTILLEKRIWKVREFAPGNGSIQTFFDNYDAYDFNDDEKYTIFFGLFVIGFILLAGFNQLTGAEMVNPSVSLIIINLFVFGLSLGGILTLNLSPFDFLDQFGFFFVLFPASLGFYLGVLKRT